VRLGDVPQGFTLTVLFDNITGEIIVSERSTSGPIVLAPGVQGSLLLIDFEVRSGTSLGTTRINLLGEGRVGNTVLYTSMNDGDLTLTPAPTDSDLDPTDGIITVSEMITSQPTTATQIASPSVIPSVFSLVAPGTG